MLELVDVNKTYAGEAEAVCVLNEINLTVEPGQSVSFTGPSGSGKTTLLNLIGGLDGPTSGKVFLNRTNLASLREGELSRLRIRRSVLCFNFIICCRNVRCWKMCFCRHWRRISLKSRKARLINVRLNCWRKSVCRTIIMCARGSSAGVSVNVCGGACLDQSAAVIAGG